MRFQKLQGILLCLLILSFLNSCSVRKSSIQMATSDVLIYDVNYGQKSQQLEIEIISKSTDVVFKYRLIDNSKIAGKVTISSDAMLKAIEQDNIWDGGDKNLTNKTAVWMSKEIYKKIEAGEETAIPFRQGFTYHNPNFQLVSKTELEVSVNGKLQKLPALFIEDTNGKGFKYWIWDNPSDPMILKLDLGWAMSLTQIIKP